MRSPKFYVAPLRKRKLLRRRRNGRSVAKTFYDLNEKERRMNEVKKFVQTHLTEWEKMPVDFKETYKAILDSSRRVQHDVHRFLASEKTRLRINFINLVDVLPVISEDTFVNCVNVIREDIVNSERVTDTVLSTSVSQQNLCSKSLPGMLFSPVLPSPLAASPSTSLLPIAPSLSTALALPSITSLPSLTPLSSLSSISPLPSVSTSSSVSSPPSDLSESSSPCLNKDKPIPSIQQCFCNLDYPHGSNRKGDYSHPRRSSSSRNLNAMETREYVQYVLDALAPLVNLNTMNARYYRAKATVMRNAAYMKNSYLRTPTHLINSAGVTTPTGLGHSADMRRPPYLTRSLYIATLPEAIRARQMRNCQDQTRPIPYFLQGNRPYTHYAKFCRQPGDDYTKDPIMIATQEAIKSARLIRMSIAMNTLRVHDQTATENNSGLETPMMDNTRHKHVHKHQSRETSRRPTGMEACTSPMRKFQMPCRQRDDSERLLTCHADVQRTTANPAINATRRSSASISGDYKRSNDHFQETMSFSSGHQNEVHDAKKRKLLDTKNSKSSSQNSSHRHISDC